MSINKNSRKDGDATINGIYMFLFEVDFYEYLKRVCTVTFVTIYKYIKVR